VVKADAKTRNRPAVIVDHAQAEGAILVAEAAVFGVIAFRYVASAIAVMLGPVFIPFFIVPKIEWLSSGQRVPVRVRQPEIDIASKKVAIEDLRTPPCRATVDFEKVYLGLADHQETRREKFVR
jgi:hypothetical protein